MGEFQFFFDCPICEVDSVMYFLDTSKNPHQVRFYVNPYISDEKVRFMLEKKVKKQTAEIHNIVLRCPHCGEWSLYYNNIPHEVVVLISPYYLTHMYIPENMKKKIPGISKDR